MSDNSKIEWTDSTWNPIVGCSKCSPGCDNCYAEKMAKRLSAMGHEGYKSVINNSGLWNGETVCIPSAINKPLGWKKPRKIFVCSMGDLFHESVDPAFIIAVFIIIKKCPQHTFQILTKRPERALKFFQEHPLNDGLPNVWFGVTVCSQIEAGKKIPILLQIDAVVRFLSVEPMLTKIVLSEEIRHIDWVICGGENGPGARMTDPVWINNIFKQCECVQIPFFFKGWGKFMLDRYSKDIKIQNEIKHTIGYIDQRKSPEVVK